MAWIEETGQVLRPAVESIAQALIEALGILPKRIATLVHGCWKAYWKPECAHALCNAHLLRELVFLHVSTGQSWPQRMIDMLILARDTCTAARPVTTALTQG